MKKLNQFTLFDSENFFKDKKLICMRSEDDRDFETQQIVGAKYTLIVWEDNTEYGGEGEVSNAGEAFTVKVKDKAPKTVSAPVPVNIINPVCTIYGEYRNNLSVRADDIEFLNQKKVD